MDETWQNLAGVSKESRGAEAREKVKGRLVQKINASGRTVDLIEENADDQGE